MAPIARWLREYASYRTFEDGSPWPSQEKLNEAADHIDALVRALAGAINELEHSGYEFDHPSLVEKRAVLAAMGTGKEP